jgi:hypothetical protein
MHHIRAPGEGILGLEIEIEEEHANGNLTTHKKPNLYRAQKDKDNMRRLPALRVLIFPAQKSAAQGSQKREQQNDIN